MNQDTKDAKLPTPPEVHYDDFLHEMAAQVSGNPDPDNPQTRGLHRIFVNVWNQAHTGLLESVDKFTKQGKTTLALEDVTRLASERVLPPVD